MKFTFFFSPQMAQVVDRGFSRFIILLEIPWIPKTGWIKALLKVLVEISIIQINLQRTLVQRFDALYFNTQGPP